MRNLKRIFEYIIIFSNYHTALFLRLKLKSRNNKLHQLKLRNGLVLWVREGTPDVCVIHEVIYSKSYYLLMDILKKTMRGVILDLGANIGIFSLFCSQTNPQLNILSFEPTVENFSLLSKNIAENKSNEKIKIIQKAVTSDGQPRYIHYNKTNPGGSSVNLNDNLNGLSETISLIDILRQNNSIFLIKMDIEGTEYEIFYNITISDLKLVKYLYIEIHNDPNNLCSRKELIKKIEKLNFAIKHEYLSVYLFENRINQEQIAS